MKKNLVRSVLMTFVTTVLLGLAYPLLVTGIAQLFFHDKANGQLITQAGALAGSRILGQPFTTPVYFHSRPSAAGTGYDAANSGGTNLGSTNQKLLDRVNGDLGTIEADHRDRLVPIDMITTSASGLDPDITPANAEFQIARVSRSRGMSEQVVRELVTKHTQGRQFGFLGEPRVNVLELNLELDRTQPIVKLNAH